MMNLEIASKNAKTIWNGANQLGTIIDLITSMEKEGWQAIEEEDINSEFVQILAPDIIAALRSIAMSLDRSVLGKSDNS